MSQETNNSSGLPIIGEGIPWQLMFDGLCRVTRFTPFASVIKEQSQSFKVVGQVPYASLDIEILIDYKYFFTSGFVMVELKHTKLPGKANMPIWNRIDFINLWEVFQEFNLAVQGLKDKRVEVLVKYRQTEFDPDTPSLKIGLYMPGSLEDIVFPPPGTTYPRADFPQPLYEWDENEEEEFRGDIFRNVWKVLTHTNHDYGDPFPYFQGKY